MDCFYGSIEQRDNPDIQGKPVAVGDSDKMRGVIAAASKEAHRSGIRSAMATKSAKKKIPRLIIVPPRFDVYKKEAKKIQKILARYSDTIEIVGNDEAYMDISEAKLDTRMAILVAKRIKEDILKETELTASAGVASNKFLAKIASQMHFPDGLTAVLPQQAQPFIDDLPIEKFENVGKANSKKMHRLRIRHGADLRKINKADLIKFFGKNGLYYYDICRGIDPRPVVSHMGIPDFSVANSIIPATKDKDEQQKTYQATVEKLKKSLKEGTKVSKIVVRLRKSDFRTVKKSLVLEAPTEDIAVIQKHIDDLYSSITYKGLTALSFHLYL